MINVYVISYISNSYWAIKWRFKFAHKSWFISNCDDFLKRTIRRWLKLKRKVPKNFVLKQCSTYLLPPNLLRLRLLFYFRNVSNLDKEVDLRPRPLGGRRPRGLDPRKANWESSFDVCPSFDDFETKPCKKWNVLYNKNKLYFKQITKKLQSVICIPLCYGVGW